MQKEGKHISAKLRVGLLESMISKRKLPYNIKIFLQGTLKFVEAFDTQS